MPCKFSPICKFHPQENGYCVGHQGFAPGKAKKVIAPIAKVSEKRKVINKEYKKIVKKALDEDPICKVQSPVCTKVAQGLHHKQKRSPANLTKASNLIECCNACNLYIEENPVWAQENGHTISRFAKS